MIKINKHIEIVSSTASGLSSMSKRSREAILAVLAKHYASVGITIVNNISDLEDLVAHRPDLVFLGMKFIPVDCTLGLHDPQKIWITDYLDEHEIAYTGSGQLAHELELNKHLAKQRVLNAGLKTSPFYVFKQNQQNDRDEMSLTFPLFIKPTNRGGGLGIDCDSMVHNFDKMQLKVQSLATEFQSDALVEEYLSGREFSVGILKNEYSEDLVVMPIELVAEGNAQGGRILSQEVKTSNQETVLPVIDTKTRAQVIDLATRVFGALGARDYGRIDIRLDEAGTPHFLEANLIPSLISGYGSFPKACVLNIGMDYETMILSIVRLGLAHPPILAVQEAEPASATIFNPIATTVLV